MNFSLDDFPKKAHFQKRRSIYGLSHPRPKKFRKLPSAARFFTKR